MNNSKVHESVQDDLSELKKIISCLSYCFLNTGLLMTSSKILIPVYFNFNQTQKNDCRFENGLNGIDVEYKLVREANFYK